MNGKPLGSLIVQRGKNGGFVLRGDVERVAAPGVKDTMQRRTISREEIVTEWSYTIREVTKEERLERTDDLLKVKD